MPQLWPRETFIALRARRTAHQVAGDIVNPHVQISAVPCSGCGKDVPLPLENLEPLVECPHCGQPTPLPSNFVTDLDVYFSEQDLAERAEHLAKRVDRLRDRRRQPMSVLAIIVLGLMIGMMLLDLFMALTK